MKKTPKTPLVGTTRIRPSVTVRICAHRVILDQSHNSSTHGPAVNQVPAPYQTGNRGQVIQEETWPNGGRVLSD